MDLSWIERRLQRGEDGAHEFKSVARSGFRVDALDLGQAIAAMANSGGGFVLLGVEDDGTPSGIGSAEQVDALARQVSQVCQDRIRPPLPCRVHKAAAGASPLLVVEVPGFTASRPYRIRDVYYVRDGPRSRPASNDELKTILQSEGYHHDEAPVGEASYADLDPRRIQEFFGVAYGRTLNDEDTRAYLHALRCVNRSGQPTVTGILCFGLDPQRWLPDARITAVRLPGTDIGPEVSDRQEIGGTLDTQVEQAFAFLKRHVPEPYRIEGGVRHELGIADEVRREALVNAVVHRDYRISAQTRLLVFDDRIELTSPGGLLNSLTIESIRLGLTQRRNSRICAVLAQAMRRENIGAGVKLMIRMQRQRGLPEPEIEVIGGQLRVTLRWRSVG